MHPVPGRPLPEGWVYIEHPDVGVADSPVKRTALPTWEKAGWTEVADDADDADADADAAEPIPGAEAGEATTSPRRSRAAAADQTVKEV